MWTTYARFFKSDSQCTPDVAEKKLTRNQRKAVCRRTKVHEKILARHDERDAMDEAIEQAAMALVEVGHGVGDDDDVKQCSCKR